MISQPATLNYFVPGVQLPEARKPVAKDHDARRRRSMMKVAILTTDNRQHHRRYDLPTPYFGTAPEALLQGFAQLEGVEVHVVSCTRQPMKSPEKLAPNIFYHSVLVPKIGWMKTMYQGCIRATRKKLREIQPDIVHGQGTEVDCGIASVFSGFPNVLTIHGNMRLIAEVNHEKPFSYNWLAARLERFTLPRSGGVVCITHYTEAAVRDLAKRTWILPNAVDSAFFDVRPEPPPNKPPQILCVGVICVRKNQNAFIRALDPLAGQHKFEVLFLGSVSPGRAYDDEFLSLIQSRPWCRHLGVAGREELRKYFSEASMLVLPSLEDNCPMTVLESMAAGVPVMAANVGGVPDLVEDEATGIFCNPLNAASMSAAVEKILKDSCAAREMATRANQKARERFHPKVIAQGHLKIYREFLRTDS